MTLFPTLHHMAFEMVMAQAQTALGSLLEVGGADMVTLQTD